MVFHHKLKNTGIIVVKISTFVFETQQHQKKSKKFCDSFAFYKKSHLALEGPQDFSRSDSSRFGVKGR